MQLVEIADSNKILCNLVFVIFKNIPSLLIKDLDQSPVAIFWLRIFAKRKKDDYNVFKIENIKHNAK